MRPTSLATACERRALPAVLVLARSFLRHHRDARALVVVADADLALPPVDHERLRTIAGSELGVEHFELLAAALDAPGLARALAPFALAAVDGPAVYLAPDADVRGPLELPEHGIAVAASGGGGGVCDDGFVGVAGDGTGTVLDWWCERVRALDLEERPLDAAVARFEAVRLVRDPGWAVAPWNVGERGLRQSGGRLVVDGGRPVAWLRFPGVDPGRPEVMPGLDVERDEAFARAFDDYAAQLRAVNGAAPTPERPGFERMADGTPLDERLRRLFAAGVRAGELTRGPFDEVGCLAFTRWLNESDPRPEAGGVSRYLHDLWLGRTDLQRLYPDLRDPEHRTGFQSWAVVHGSGEVPIPPILRPLDPPGADRRLGSLPEAPPLGVNVAGYFQSELGVGAAACRVIRALDAAHVPLLPVQGTIVPPSRREHEYGSTPTAAAPFPFNVVCVNADGLPEFARDAGSAFFAGRYTIGSWWWELPDFPERYRGAFDHVDEVWVGTRYVHDAIAPVSPVPVTRIPLPVEAPRVTPRSRTELDLPEGFLCLFMFDYNSVFERKNPLGLIEAFTRAFDQRSGAQLVIKCINGERHPAAHQRLLLCAGRHPHVHVIHRYVSAAERDAMVAACDVYASLHRSEGFGLTLADAMALGRPTIATGWSGNLDFMDDGTSWLVPYELVAVGDGNEPYQPDSHWAEPDLDVAAAALRAVREQPEEAQRRAAAGAERIRAEHAPAVVGKAMRTRLEALQPRIADRTRARGERSAVAAREAVAQARERVEARPPATRHGGPRRLARRVLMGVRRPFVARRRHVDVGLVDAIERVAADAFRHQDEAVAAHAGISAVSLARERRWQEQTVTFELLAGTLQARAEELERRTTELAEALERTRAQLRPLREGAEAIPYAAGEPFELFRHAVAGRVLGYRDEPSIDDPVVAYRLFEEVFRGSRERIAGLLGPYVELLAGHAPVLDVGCGRGELLELLRGAGIEARGVDLDEGMARGARELGLDVTVADGVEHLESLPAGSLGAISSIHVIEHLPYEALQRFMRSACRALRPGGLLTCETVNPHAPFALKTFWVDPTHRHPLFPESALVLARGAGFPTAFYAYLRGTRDVERDRFGEDSYTLVAEAGGG